MPDSDQILDKYAQLKLDLKLQEEEKQRKIQEELDAKNPLKQYEKIQRELAESKKKYSKEIKENITETKEKQSQQPAQVKENQRNPRSGLGAKKRQMRTPRPKPHPNQENQMLLP